MAIIKIAEVSQLKKQVNSMKLADIRKEEMLKERNRLWFAEYTREYIRVLRGYADENMRIAQSHTNKTRRFIELEDYKRNLKKCEEIEDEYKKRYNQLIEKNWLAKETENLTYNSLIEDIASLSSSGRFSDKVGVLCMPVINDTYKFYLSFVDKKDEIIIFGNNEAGRQIITNEIDDALKDIILKRNLVLLFNIKNKNVILDETYHAHLDEEYYPGRVRGHQWDIQKDSRYRSFLVSLQRLSVFSAIIVFLFIAIESYFNIHISTKLVLGVGIGFPVAGISFFDLLEENKIPVMSSNLKYIGLCLIIFGFIALLLTFFSQFHYILTAACALSIGIWMLKLSSKEIPKEIINASTNLFCDKCIGRGKIEAASSISDCSKCSGTGLLGEHIEQQLIIKKIAYRRRLAVIFALLYPVVLSLFFVALR